MNKNFIKSLALSSVLLCTSSIPVFADMNVSRISGYDRYETAVNSNKKYMNQANGNLAVIASGNDFKTALYGSHLSSALNVPYFVNPKHGVRTDILNELKRLKVNRVYIMGDYNILDKSLDNTFKSKGIKVERLYSEELSYKVDNIIFNTFHYGENRGDISMSILIDDNKFPDLLSSIPFTSIMARDDRMGLLRYPEDDFIEEDTYIDGFGFIIGGEKSVPVKFWTGGKADYPDSPKPNYVQDNGLHLEMGEGYKYYYGRIYGQNRYETAVEIAKAYKKMFNKGASTIVLVNGENYPDALSSSLVATQSNGSVLLTQPNKLNENTAKYIKDNNIKNIIIVGGEKSISKNVENELKSFY